MFGSYDTQTLPQIKIIRQITTICDVIFDKNRGKPPY